MVHGASVDAGVQELRDARATCAAPAVGDDGALEAGDHVVSRAPGPRVVFGQAQKVGRPHRGALPTFSKVANLIFPKFFWGGK